MDSELSTVKVTRIEGNLITRLMTKRITLYFIALAIRLIIAGLFIEPADYAVFLETGRDILLLKTNIYFEESLQYKFNYFPLAYLAILPGQLLYFLLPFKNKILQRIFLKIPMILGELWLAYMFKPKSSLLSSPHQLTNETNTSCITKYELIILFNPILIYAGSLKSQFDIFPAILFLYAWRFFKTEQDYFAGISAGAAFFFKPYSAIFIAFLGLSLLKANINRVTRFSVGIMAISLPVVGFGAIMNFDGMIKHALLFHLDRTPDGVGSLTAMIYSLIHLIYTSTTYLDESSFNFVTLIITAIGSVILAIIFIILAIKLWQSENMHLTILKTIILAFIAFYLFNKVFLFHYLAPLVPLWVEYQKDSGNLISMTQIAWAVSMIPFSMIFRLARMTPVDIQLELGYYYILIIWIVCMILHFLLLVSAYLFRISLFPDRKIKLIYFFFIILAPFHLFMQIITSTCFAGGEAFFPDFIDKSWIFCP